jgi:signal transduction histidine kinase
MQVFLSSDARASKAEFARDDVRIEQLRRLTEISRALTYTTSLEQVMRLTVERGAALLDSSAAVLMLNDAHGLLEIRASHGISEERLTRFSAQSHDLIARLQGLLIVQHDSFVAVPLVVGGEVTGLVAVATVEHATTDDEWLLSALADQAAVALQNAWLGGEVRADLEDRLRASEGETSAKDRALATLAHDIRTPLGAIDAYCDLMLEDMYGPINDRQREALARVRMSGRHLLSLLDNVMDMARLSAGVVQVKAVPVRLEEIAREALQMLIPAADAKFQTLHLGRLSDVVVIGDHERIRQIVVNLVANAVKFTPEDRSIVITTSQVTIGGVSSGEIRVSDDGPGIPPDEQDLIFQPYYRSKTTADRPGVGLGLAISRALVAQMGGELLLESEAGHGSAFMVRLPVH